MAASFPPRPRPASRASSNASPPPSPSLTAATTHADESSSSSATTPMTAPTSSSSAATNVSGPHSPLSSPSIELDRPDLSGSSARMFPIRTVKYPTSYSPSMLKRDPVPLLNPPSKVLSSAAAAAAASSTAATAADADKGLGIQGGGSAFAAPAARESSLGKTGGSVPSIASTPSETTITDAIDPADTTPPAVSTSRASDLTPFRIPATSPPPSVVSTSSTLDIPFESLPRPPEHSSLNADGQPIRSLAPYLDDSLQYRDPVSQEQLSDVGSPRTHGTSSISESTNAAEVYLTNRFTHQVNPEDGTSWVLTGRKGVLEKCEDEPIHAPGAVQAFGVLVCFDEVPNDEMDDEDGDGDDDDDDDFDPDNFDELKAPVDRMWKVAQVSENSALITKYSPSDLFRLPRGLLSIFPPEDRETIVDALEALDLRDTEQGQEIANGASKQEQQKMDHGPMHFVVTGLGPRHRKTGERPEWTVHAAIHRPDRVNQPSRVIVEFELVTDKKHPLRPPAAGPNDPALPKGGMAPPPMSPFASADDPEPSVDDLLLSTQTIVKPLRALARQKARAARAARLARTNRTADSASSAASSSSTSSRPVEADQPLDVVGLLSQINDQLSQTEDLEHFLRVVAGVFKELTEFDRVMVYQFDEAWNGRVVAEMVDWSRTRDLFRGLNFPATDIPAQARELYKINKVRLLYDRDQPTARMCCRSLEEVQHPLNMTHSHLRAMSPIHCVYLKNMGVRSSFSVSITAFGDLWGLVAMHTYHPTHGTRVSFPARQLCRLLGDSISRNIERLSYHKRLYARKLINTAPTEANPTGYIVAKAEDLLTLFDADFGVLSISDEAKILGQAAKLDNVLINSEYRSNIVRTQNIRADFPDIDYPTAFELIAGFLVVPLSSTGRDFIVFFRKGQLEEVHWAGNPHANKVQQDGREYRPLEPRKSFKIWSETVVGKCRPWSDEQVETAGVLCLIYGKFIAVWRQKESALAANQLTNLLLANASHELRTPLNSIINYIELALDGPVDGEVRENLTRSHEASRSLIYVINDLLDLTRTERGNELALSDPFDLPATIEDAVAMHKAEALRRGLTLDVIESPSGTPPTLLGDRGKVRQVVANIVANAVKHTDRGGVLIEWGELADTNMEDAADHRQDSIRIGISVTDTGCGISEEKLEHIFRQFEQVSTVEENEDAIGLQKAQQQQQQNAVGLGLAVVARIVRNLNGQLRVESQVGEGSKFQLVFPFRLPPGQRAIAGPEGEQAAPAARAEQPSITGQETMRATSVAAESTVAGSTRASPHLERRHSFGSVGSVASGGSTGTVGSAGAKSEIDSLLSDFSSSHMNPRATQASRPTGSSAGSRQSRKSRSSRRSIESSRPHYPGEVSITDSGTPLRPVKIPNPMGDAPEAVNLGRRKSLTSASPPATSATEPSPAAAYRATFSPLGSPTLSHSSSISSGHRSERRTDTRRGSADVSRSDAKERREVPAGPPASDQAVKATTPPHVSDFKRKVPTGEKAPRMTPLRVLVVEDELVNRLILEKRLKKEGHEVHIAEHGGVALRMLEEDIGYDLVLMDLQMPIVNGFECSTGIRRLEANLKTQLTERRPTAIVNGRIPILAVSASLHESQRPDIEQAGLDGWLLKPVNSERLYRLMEGTLDTTKRSEDLYQPGSWERGGWLDVAPSQRAARKQQQQQQQQQQQEHARRSSIAKSPTSPRMAHGRSSESAPPMSPLLGSVSTSPQQFVFAPKPPPPPST